MSETDLKRAVTKYLEMSGWLVTRVQAGGYHGGKRLAKKGTADLVCCAGGTYVELEVKLPNGRVSPGQEKRREEVVRRGGMYWVVRSMDGLKLLVEQHKGDMRRC